MIEPVSEKNIDDVIPLVREYMQFYKIADISDERNRAFFSQFGEDNPAGCQFLFRESGEPAGFATVYLTFTTSITSRVAVLNDLYTVAECRGKGIGRALIEHSRQYATRNGAARLQWVTAPDNTQAQLLYDDLKTSKSTWLFYTYNV